MKIRTMATLTALELAASLAACGQQSQQAADKAKAEAAKAAEAKIEFRAHPDSVHAGALGAALWGAFRARKLSKLGVSLASGGDA